MGCARSVGSGAASRVCMRLIGRRGRVARTISDSEAQNGHVQCHTPFCLAGCEPSRRALAASLKTSVYIERESGRDRESVSSVLRPTNCSPVCVPARLATTPHLMNGACRCVCQRRPRSRCVCVCLAFAASSASATTLYGLRSARSCIHCICRTRSCTLCLYSVGS